ncbi:zinc ribbon domain-containing protein [Halorussus salilacus]|uniref:double zinc ribbon domain-containing protein n=1 Tax=Halorussus salilacus TaxID=2953750 RepID=UPI00209F8386|nr:zinc ribbon domain-containing protein [Halorussus salilacus]USZ69248.1 zinc ribbon domain-containing protein [Halorussus salilacus]
MSKITFRADEDLIERIEALDASKSEVMRDALRAYLDREAESASESSDADESLDAALAERVDELVAERLAAREAARPRTREARAARADRAQDVNVTVTLETDAPVRASDADAEPRRADDRQRSSNARRSDGHGERNDAESACGQCGESLSDDHVYCPNCGEKTARRVFCECGDEVRSDWGFCPSCGRRTPAADVLDRS